MTTEAFDDLVDIYDALVDWPHRLAHEAPFYQELFAEVGVRRVLDVACGTGQHAAMFHSWGLEVEGADISAGMIARCREAFGESETLRWTVRSFDSPCDAPGTFDAAVCVGNSLALAGDLETVGHAVGAMVAALRPGGVCIIGVLNLWRLPEGPTTWQKQKRLTGGDADRVVLKGIHRVGSRGFIDLIELTLEADGGLAGRVDAPTFLGLEAEELLATASRAGAEDAQFYGTFARDPYDRAQSPDLILVCRRASSLA